MADDDAELQVGVTAADDGAAAVFTDMKAQVQDMVLGFEAFTRRVNQSIEGISKLRAEMSALAEASKDKNADIKVLEQRRADLNAEITAHRDQMKLDQIERANVNTVINKTSLPDGRTIGQAGFTDQFARGLVTGIDTSSEQFEARLKLAAQRASKRLLSTMTEAMDAEMRKAELAVRTDVMKYGSPEAAARQFSYREIDEQKKALRYGGATNYDEYRQFQSAQSLDKQRQAALAVQATQEYKAAQRVEADQQDAASALERQRSRTIQANYVREERAKQRAEQQQLDEQDSAVTALERQRSRTIQANYVREERDRQRAEKRAQMEQDSAAAALGRQRDSTIERNFIKETNDAARAAARERADQESAVRALGRQRDKTIERDFLKEQNDLARAAAKQRADEESAARALGRQRDKTIERDFVKEQADQESAVKALDRQRSRAYEAQFTREERERQRQERAAAREAERAEAAGAGGNSASHEQRGLTSGLIGIATAGFAIAGVLETADSLKVLDDEIARFRAITQAGSDEAKTFKEQLLDLGGASKFSMSEMAEAAVDLAQNGLSTTEVMQALPAAMNLAAASGTSLHNSIEVLTSVLGSYNLEASQTGDIANIMTGALNKTRLTIEQLSYGLQYSSDIASQMGISVTELTSVFGGLAQAGVRSGSVMGTAVRQIIREFENPTQKLQAELRTLGITMEDIDIKTHGLMGVLDNLKEKGFGTAEAIRGLEARTVTTFAAMQIQEDTIKRLNTELLLYNGAVDGASLANESLVARLTHLGNEILELADHAFSPFMDVLKGTVDAFGGVLHAANALGPVLPVLGTALVSVGLGLGTVAAINAASGFVSAAQGLFALGKAAEGAAVGIGILEVASGPIGLLVAGLTAAIVLWTEFGYSAATVTRQMDALKESISNTDAQIRENEVSSQMLDKSINSILEKRKHLNEDPLDRKTTIIEMQKQFADLGLTVDANANSIDELIAALRRLREEQARNAPDLLAKQIDQRTKEIELRSRSEQAEGDESRARLEGGRAQLDLVTGRPSNPARDEYARMGFADIYDLVTDRSKINGNDVFGQTNSAVARLQTQLAQMRDAKKEDDPDFQRVSDLLTELKSARNYRTQTQSEALTLDRDRTAYSEAVVKMQPNFLNVAKQTTDLRQGFTDRVNEIADKKQDPRAEVAEIDALKREYEAKVTALRTVAEDEQRKLSDNGTSPEVLRNTWGETLAKLKSLDNLATSAVKNANSMRAMVERPQLEDEIRELETRKRGLDKIAQESNDPDEINRAYATMETLLKQVSDKKKEIIGIKNDAHQISPDEYKGQTDAEDRDLQDQQAALDDARLQHMKRITEKNLQMQDRAAAMQLKIINDQIAEIEKTKRDPRTAETEITKLTKALDDLINQRTKLLYEKADTDTARDRLNTPRTYVPTDAAATGTVQRRIIDGLAAGGRADLAPFAMRLIEHESGFDPNVLNKQGSGAKGLFQVMPKTAPGLGLDPSRNWTVEEQMAALIKYDQGAISDFQKRMGRAPSDDREHYAIYQQGGAGAANLLNSPSRLAYEVVGRQQVLQNGGTLGMTSKEFFDHITANFAGEGNSKFLRPAADGLDAANADQKRQADKGAAETHRSDSLGDAQRNSRDVKASTNIADKESNSRITDLTRQMSDPSATPDEAASAAAEIARLHREQAARALQRYDADPQDRTGKEQDDDRLGTRMDSTNRFVGGVQKSADAIEKAGSAKDKEDLKRLTEELKKMEDSGKATPAETRATGAQIEELTKRINLTDELNGKVKALAFIEDQLATASKDQNLDQKSLNLLTTDEVRLRKEIADLQARQKLGADLKARPADLSTATNKGTETFFTSAGLYDPKKGEWKSTTDEIAGAWDGMLTGMNSGMQKFFTDWANGTKRGKDAFRDFGVGILQTMEQIVVKMLSENILKTMFGGVLGSAQAPGGVGGIGGLVSGLGGLLGGAGSGLAGLFGGGGGAVAMGLGGIGHMSTGGIIPGVDVGRDSVPMLTQPGEAILNQSAVAAVGRDSINQLNETGNAIISKQAATMGDPPTQQVPTPVNIWLAHPDAVPPPGPRDIVHMVASDISAGGQMKTLIKQVQAGQI